MPEQPQPTPQPRSSRRRPLRLLLRLALGLVALLLALVVSVVCFALFPPSDLLRRAVLPVAREILNHPNLQIGRLHLRPLSQIEIRDLWLGPPAGYARPLFTVKRIVVRYDLRQVQAGVIRVEQVQVERPFLTVESRAGKLNWIAFIEGLPRSEPKPEEEETKEPSSLRIIIDRVAVIGLGAEVDDGTHRASLDSLHLALWGMVTPERTDVHLSVQLEPLLPARPGVTVLVRQPQPLGAELDADLRLDVRATQRPSLRPDLKPDIQASVGVELKAASRRIQAPWPLPPVRLETALRLEADSARDRARLESLRLSFNQTELVRLAATLKGLFKPQQVDLLLSRLHLPLDQLAPYLRAVDPSVVELGGLVEVRDLRLRSDLGGSRLPGLKGTVTVHKLRAGLDRPGLKARLRDLDLKLALTTRPSSGGTAPTPGAVLKALPSLSDEPGAADRVPPASRSGIRQRDLSAPPTRPTGLQVTPGVMLHGHVRLGEARAAGATIRGLDLRLAAAADLRGLSTLQAFGSKLRLRIPHLQYNHPGLGPLLLGLHSDVTASGDWRRQQVSVNQLRLELPNLLGVRLSASAEELGKRSLALDLRVEPAPLAQLALRLPAALRRQLAGTRLGGKLSLGLKVAGRLPEKLLAGAPVTPQGLMALPLKLDARIDLDDISVQDRPRQLALSGLRGPITCKGRPSDLTVTTDLRLASVTKPDQQIRLKGVSLPLSVHLTPRQLEAHLALTATQLLKDDMGLATHGLRLAADIATALPPLHRLLSRGPPPVGKTRLLLTHGVHDFRMTTPGNSLRTGAIENQLQLSYDPARPDNTRIDLKSDIAWLAQLEQRAAAASRSAPQGREDRRARVSGLSIGGSVNVALPVQQLAAGKTGAVGGAKGRLALGIKSMRLFAPGNRIDGQGLAVTLDLDHDPKRPDAARAVVTTTLDTLDHDQQKVRVSQLKLALRSAVRGIVLRLPQPVIKLEKVDSRMTLEVGSIHKQGLHPLRRTTLELEADLSHELKDAELRRLALRVPSNGVHLELSGRASGLLPHRPGQLPQFEVALNAGLDNPMANSYGRATFLLPGLRASGKAGVKLRARSSGQGQITVDARLLATAFNLWSATGTVQREKDGSTLTIVQRLNVRDVNMDVPLSQSVTMDSAGRVDLPRPKRSIFKRDAAGSDVLHNTLRPFGGRRSALSVGGVVLRQQIAARSPENKLLSTVRRKIVLDRLAMDLAVRDSSLYIDRFYLKLFDGDIAGALQVQLLKLKPGQIPDVRLGLKTQVTGVNLAYLDPAVTERSSKTEVSALVDLRAQPYREHVEGRINITRLSLDMLDSLLAYLDPNGVNQGVKENRKLINSWYFKLAKPKVQLVSIWISHGNLNMDIEMNAIAGVNTIIRRNLQQNSIRRLDILPFLHNALGTSPESGEEP